MDAMAVDALGKGGSAPDLPKEGFDVIPMWVADMNFPTVPTVPEAIKKRADHAAYGYFSPREEYFNAIIQWQRVRNGVEGILPEHIGYANGVLGGVATALNVICARGDSVLLHGVFADDSPNDYLLGLAAFVPDHGPCGGLYLGSGGVLPD